MSEPAAWLRQPDESAEAYKAFQAYLKLAVPRSIDVAYDKQRKGYKKATRTGARAAGSWTKWSARHRWVERARLYDEHDDRLRDAARQKAVAAEAAKWAKRQEQQRERDYALGEKFQKRAKELSTSAFDTITPSSVARMGEAGSKLARLAAGMATDRPDVRITGSAGGGPALDLSDKSDEQLQQYLRDMAHTAIVIANAFAVAGAGDAARNGAAGGAAGGNRAGEGARAAHAGSGDGLRGAAADEG